MSSQLRFGDIWPYRDLLVSGVLSTLILTLVCGAVALVIGVILAECVRSRIRLVRFIATAYVEVVRNTPFIVQLFFIFFGLPAMGIRLNAWYAAIITLSLHVGAYDGEIIRAGLDASPKGLIEAGRSLGLSPRQVFFRIVLPPAVQRIYLPLVGQLILLLMESAIVSQISVAELTFQAQYIQSRNFRAFEIYIVVTLIYMALGFAMKYVAIGLEPMLFRWRRAR